MSDKITFTLHELVAEIDASADAMLSAHYGVSASQFIFLATLVDVEPTDVTTLARCLGVSKAAVSKRVPSLEQAGWITVHDDPGHGRRLVVEATERARELVESAGADLDAQFATVLDDPRARDIDLAFLNDQMTTLTTILREKGQQA